ARGPRRVRPDLRRDGNLGALLQPSPDGRLRASHRALRAADLLAVDRARDRRGRSRHCSTAVARASKYRTAASPTALVPPYATAPLSAHPATGTKSRSWRAAARKPNPAPTTPGSSPARLTSTSSPYASAIRNTSRIWLSVSTG